MTPWQIVKVIVATGFAAAAAVCIFVAQPLVVMLAVTSIAFSQLPV